jgi:DNA-binding SARP family transcriptional activator
LITFGGYGFHHYNSVLYKYNPVAGKWESDSLSETIAPRYLGSMGYSGDKNILYFGGFGNESGRQEEFPRNYYDLFSINIEDATTEKIGEYPNPEEHFTNSSSMVINKKNRRFYSLSYPNQRYASVVKLHEYSLDNLEYRVVGDSIPYYFNDVDSYCDLFLNSDSSELYSVLSYVRNNTSEIHIYSIAYPPLSQEEVIQRLTSRPNVWMKLLFALIPGLLVIFICYRKKWLKRMDTGNTDIDRIPVNEEEPVAYDSPLVEQKDSSINLLGVFQVVDTDGNNITKNFTPTTTQLFLLLLMSTVKKGKGVTSQELRRILWYDKNDESARNNRNVYINKLRSILKSFRELKIINTGGNWTIQFEKDVFCDYEKALRLIKVLQTGDYFSIKLLTELVDIGLKGTLLPYIQQSEWLEPYQSDYANQLIECLMKYSKRDEVKSDLLFLLKIADVIQSHDNIDEDAIRLKCYALYRLGRKNQALQAFNKFAADYEYLLAVKPNLVFDELVL